MVKGQKTFKNLLENSEKIVTAFAEVLQNSGYNVRVLPKTLSPSVEERWEHVDDGDIEIIQRIEVKHWPNINFTSVEDIPYKEIIVDEKYKIDKKHNSSLYMYVIVNALCTHCILIPQHTRKHWKVKNKIDGREGRRASFYMIDKKYVTVQRLPKKLI